MSFLLKYCTRPAATDTQPFQKAANPRPEHAFVSAVGGGALGAGIGGLLGYGMYGLTRLLDGSDVSPEELQARRLMHIGIGTGLGLSQGVRSGVRAAYRDNQSPKIDWKRIGDELIERGVMPKQDIASAPALKVPKIGQTPTTAVDAANIEAIRRILAVSAAAGGAGVLTAGLANFGTLAGRPQSVLSANEPVTVKLIDEAPTANRPWHGLRPSKPLPWITSGGQRTKLGGLTSVTQDIAEGLYNNVLKPGGLHRYLDGPLFPTTDASAKFWGVPGMVGGGALSFVGGVTAADWLLKRRREAGMEREVETAEKDYLSALNQLSTVGRKRAVETTAAAAKAAPSFLEQAYAAGAPTAAPPKPFDISAGLEPIKALFGLGQTGANALGRGAATWGALATIPAIPAGMGMYHLMRDSGERRALQEAIALRRRMRQHTAPPAIQLVPQG